MSQYSSAPPVIRPWRDIAAEVAREQDSTKLTKLIEELNRALALQGVGANPQQSDR